MRWLAAAVLVALPAQAQTVVGTAEIGDRQVELLSDRTWREAVVAEATEGEATLRWPPTGCPIIAEQLAFCGDPQRWNLFVAVQGDHDAVTWPRPDTTIVVAVEPDESYWHERVAVEDIALNDLSHYLGTPRGELVGLASSRSTIDGYEALTLRASNGSRRSPRSAALTIYASADGLELVVVSIAMERTSSSDRDRLHHEFLRGLRLGPPSK